MTEVAGGTGTANDASVVTVDNTPEALQEALNAARAEQDKRTLRDNVTRAQAKVELAERDLAAAKDELKAAKAEAAEG